MANHAISIILPVYNVSEFLDRCFQSIVNQSFEDFEVIVIDDGSTDSSGQICDKWAEKDPRISVYHYANSGVAAARNIGIEKSTGKYVYFIDPDDWIEPDLLQDNYEIALTNDLDFVIFGFYKEQQINGKPVTLKMAPDRLEMFTKNEIIEKLVLLLSKTNGFSVWTKLISKKFLTENNITFPSMKRGQDMAFSLEMYRMAQRIFVNEKCYYHYNAFTSANKFDPAIFESHLLLYNRIFNLFPDWMENKANFIYAVKLFVIWFGYVVPANIVGTAKLTKKQKLANLSNMLTDPDIKSYLKSFSGVQGLPLQSKVYLHVLAVKSPRLLYLVTAAARMVNSRSRINFKKAL